MYPKIRKDLGDKAAQLDDKKVKERHPTRVN